MSIDYRNNHYVPIWYQRRFLPPGCHELLYLDKKPEVFRDGRGVSHTRREVQRQGFRRGFAQRDLYTTYFESKLLTEIEQKFIGEIDSRGRNAVAYFGDFQHPWEGTNVFRDMLLYMSTQKLRTPKGLGWLRETAAGKAIPVLSAMVSLREMYCAIWTECIWQIASAQHSDTKFIISDHPVTTYNRRCGPKSRWCRDFSDPDVRFHATHTVFPLSFEKVLILTNLSWIRNPYQKETEMRPNPSMFREALFNFLEIQTLRDLSEHEVREINFIIKSRAHRYIAAAKEDWLFPERYVTKSDWHDYGNGYLLMPDPRGVPYGGETIMGFKDGTSAAVDEFGRRPWQGGYSGGRKRVGSDWNSFQRFQSEFARLFGPVRRGRSSTNLRLDADRDAEEWHRHRLDSEDLWKRRMSGAGSLFRAK